MFTFMCECTWVAVLPMPITGCGHVAYTGQLFFNDEISDAVATHKPYAKHDVTRGRHVEDAVFVTQHGSGSMLTRRQLHKRSIEDGCVATAVLGINPNAIPGSLILETAFIL